MKAHKKITETLDYCLNHCDNDDEYNLVLWVRFHLEEAFDVELREHPAHKNPKGYAFR